MTSSFVSTSESREIRMSPASLHGAGWLAEGVGFEPTRACALPVFKTGAINHSTTPPGAREVGVIDLNRPRAVW